jgi:hypothetical protein
MYYINEYYDKKRGHHCTCLMGACKPMPGSCRQVEPTVRMYMTNNRGFRLRFKGKPRTICHTEVLDVLKGVI